MPRMDSDRFAMSIDTGRRLFGICLVAVTHPQRSFDAPDNASNGATYNRADWTGNPATLVHPMRKTARNPLGLRTKWHSESCNHSYDQELISHQTAPLFGLKATVWSTIKAI